MYDKMKKLLDELVNGNSTIMLGFVLTDMFCICFMFFIYEMPIEIVMGLCALAGTIIAGIIMNKATFSGGSHLCGPDRCPEEGGGGSPPSAAPPAATAATTTAAAGGRQHLCAPGQFLQRQGLYLACQRLPPGVLSLRLANLPLPRP